MCHSMDTLPVQSAWKKQSESQASDIDRTKKQAHCLGP